MPIISRIGHLHPAQWAYVMVVLVVAGDGFLTDSTAVILVAALLAVPSSLAAVPAYYLAYGLLAQVPGANPSSSSGSSSCTTAGECTTSTSGDLADWFAVTADVLGILALTAAALLNMLLLQALLTARRQRRDRTAGARP
ncbi:MULTISPECIES: hypothetical protein [unclassified Nocardioides]|uniref:hypothetical protein n=1 Tax=unclassified Nocardioides TaxID=2615069 RepID=UPI0000571B10|nr:MULTISPECIES: hypothetical protein [unclassified Nocardioides]ABL82863.1 hypothetical protein Noca_3361 [Nocardioides sp. JS614]